MLSQNIKKKFKEKSFTSLRKTFFKANWLCDEKVCIATLVKLYV